MTDREKLPVQALRPKLEDLLKQATVERSHFYVGSVIRETLAFIAALTEEPQKVDDVPMVALPLVNGERQ